jgi:hypothetical protein
MRAVATRRVRWRRVAAGCDAMRADANARESAATSPVVTRRSREFKFESRDGGARDEPRANERDASLRRRRERSVRGRATTATRE